VQPSEPQRNVLSLRISVTMLRPTCWSLTVLEGNTVLKLLCSARARASASLQAAKDDKLRMVSPRPRAASAAIVAPLAPMYVSTLRAEPPPVSQLLVPDVMPKV